MKNVSNLSIIGAIILISTLSCSNNSKHETSSDTYSVSEIGIQKEEEYISENATLNGVNGASMEQRVSDNMTKPAPSQIVPNFISSIGASNAFDDNTHKFIRTAKTRFKVKNTVSATQAIEDIAIKNKGFIIKSAINNQNSYSETINISKDSAIVNYYFNLISSIELKIPASSLDSVLRQIAPLALMVEYRTIEAEDVTIRLMTDQLAQIRLGKRQKRISNAINTTGRRLNDVMSADDALDATLEEADRKTISEYDINEQIAFSTIKIDLYQDNIEYSEKILRNATTKEYTPSFGLKLIDSLSGGWNILSAILLFLVNIWPIFILFAIGAFVYIKIKRRNANK